MLGLGGEQGNFREGSHIWIPRIIPNVVRTAFGTYPFLACKT